MKIVWLLGICLLQVLAAIATSPPVRKPVEHPSDLGRHIERRRTLLREYCHNEAFIAECAPDEAIVMTAARYGRMRLGRCVTTTFGYIGCYRDVMDLMAQRCTGYQRCKIPIPDPMLENSITCNPDLKNYLEASYRCIKVITWKTYENGTLPERSSAVVVNNNNDDAYYVGRITAIGGIFPSQIFAGWASCGLDGLELFSRDYEVLVKTEPGVNLTWTSASGGSVPQGAIAGGHFPLDASHLYYVATAQTSAGQTIGYLDPAQGCATVSNNHNSRCYSTYKVLVRQ